MNGHRPAGFALLLAMIVLVVLASVAAGLSIQLTMAKRRQQYMVEYSRARYGLDSAMKYILSVLPTKSFKVEARPDVPDFSDLFWMTDAEYGMFIDSWAVTATDEQIEAVLKKDVQPDAQESGDEGLVSWLNSLFGDAAQDPNAASDPNAGIVIDPNQIDVPGPYGVPWPYVTEPIKLKIGTSEITITIEDENAKMPLSWMVTNFAKVNKQAEYSLETFGQWMQMTGAEIEELKTDLEAIHEQKMFKVNPNPIILKPAPAAGAAQTPGQPGQFAGSRRTYTRNRPGQQPQQPQPNPAAQAGANERPASAHTTDFAKLFHSSLLNQEVLGRLLPDTGLRTESPLKYLSLWGAQRININTAPRHVLEAAFMLAGDSFTAPELAQKVIEIRKEKPFAKIDELKDAGMMDTDSFNLVKDYVTVTSSFFKVRVTSHSGNASASAVATVIKEGKSMETLAILYGY